jgi:hypothetical protein
MQGWSRQLRLTPLNPVANIATKIIAGLMLGLIAVAATYIAGALTGVAMPAADWILSGLAVWILGSLVFTALGLLGPMNEILKRHTSPRPDAASSPVIRLLLADDQAMVRGALATMLGLERDIDVVAEVGRGDEVLAADRTGDGCTQRGPSRRNHRRYRTEPVAERRHRAQISAECDRQDVGAHQGGCRADRGAERVAAALSAMRRWSSDGLRRPPAAVSKGSQLRDLESQGSSTLSVLLRRLYGGTSSTLGARRRRMP